MHRDSFSERGLSLWDGSGVEIFQLKRVCRVKGTISVVSFPFSEQVKTLMRLQRSCAGHGGFFRAVHTSWFLSWSLPGLCVRYNKSPPNLKGFFRSVSLTWGIVSGKFRLWLAWFESGDGLPVQRPHSANGSCLEQSRSPGEGPWVTAVEKY